MAPVLKYHDGTAWTEVPLIGQPGPAGADGATGPQGPAGPPPNTDHLVAKTGDTMTGPLVLPGDPTAALEAAPKQYEDRYGIPGSSMIGTIVSTPIAASTGDGGVPLPPVATMGSGLTIQDVGGVPAIVVNRTGYYLLYFVLKLASDVPGANAANKRVRLEILHLAGGVRGMASIGGGEGNCSVTANVWAAAGEHFWFKLVNNVSAANTAVPLDINFIVRYLGDSH